MLQWPKVGVNHYLYRYDKCYSPTQEHSCNTLEWFMPSWCVSIVPMKAGFTQITFHKDSKSVSVEWLGISVQYFGYIKLFLSDIFLKKYFFRNTCP